MNLISNNNNNKYAYSSNNKTRVHAFYALLLPSKH